MLTAYYNTETLNQYKNYGWTHPSKRHLTFLRKLLEELCIQVDILVKAALDSMSNKFICQFSSAKFPLNNEYLYSKYVHISIGLDFFMQFKIWAN